MFLLLKKMIISHLVAKQTSSESEYIWLKGTAQVSEIVDNFISLMIVFYLEMALRWDEFNSQLQLWVEDVSTAFMEGIKVKLHPAGILPSLGVTRWGRWGVVYGTCEYWCCCLWIVQSYCWGAPYQKKRVLNMECHSTFSWVRCFPYAVLNACWVRPPSGAAAMPASSLGTFLGVVKLTVFKALWKVFS